MGLLIDKDSNKCELHCLNPCQIPLVTLEGSIKPVLHYHFTSKVMNQEPTVRQCAVVNPWKPVKLITSPTFVDGLMVMAVLLYNNLFTSLFMSGFSLCCV